MFEGNILTCNPGATNRMERLESYTDVRTLTPFLTHDLEAVVGGSSTCTGLGAGDVEPHHAPVPARVGDRRAG